MNENELIFERIWAMPSKNTFSIKPINALISKYIGGGGLWLDPFAGISPFSHLCITNDLNEEKPTDYHLECSDFLDIFEDETFDGVLFDPPYSPRQIKECYDGIGRKVHMEDTQSSFYGDRKKQLASKLKVGGIAITACWNSGGLGKCNGLELLEVLIVPHGGAHNDTIVTVGRKVESDKPLNYDLFPEENP